ncbi:MAG: Hpt domain-containing protein [Sedimentisphaerales bacterium]|nr:Hpt domain-containing protein [Sedimentisphaerales bacterium]
MTTNIQTDRKNDTDKPVINVRDIIDRIGDDIEDEFILEIIAESLSGIEKNLCKLGQAVTAANAQSIGELAHAIKGTSGNIGIEPIHVLALQLETQAKAGKIDNAQMLYDQISKIFEQVKHYTSDSDWYTKAKG